MAGETILIVEDDPASLTLTRDLLQVHGYSTIEAATGQEAVALAREKKPDLILMDMRLPDMEGTAATTLLRQDAETKDIPIVALTAFAMKGDREKMLCAGCDGYISKPINTREFPGIIESFLKEAPNIND